MRPLTRRAGACSARATVGTALGGVNADANPDNDRLSFDTRFLPPDIDHSYSTGISFSDLKVPGVAVTADWQLTDAMHLKSISAYRELDWSSGGGADGAPIECAGETPHGSLVGGSLPGAPSTDSRGR
jgi:hypothetical protein